MSGAFSAMNVAQTGASFSKLWIDTLAHNIANVNTVRPTDEEPFRSVMVTAQARLDGDLAETGSGVEVAAFEEADRGDTLVYDPAHPYADEAGYVNLPDVDLAAHMSDLIIAQRSFQANVKAIKSAEEVYRSSLQIGGR